MTRGPRSVQSELGCEGQTAHSIPCFEARGHDAIHRIDTNADHDMGRQLGLDLVCTSVSSHRETTSRVVKYLRTTTGEDGCPGCPHALFHHALWPMLLGLTHRMGTRTRTPAGRDAKFNAPRRASPLRSRWLLEYRSAGPPLREGWRSPYPARWTGRGWGITRLLLALALTLALSVASSWDAAAAQK